MDERKIKKIRQKRDDLIDRKMDEDWSLLREDVEKEVYRLQWKLKYFNLDLDNLDFE